MVKINISLMSRSQTDTSKKNGNTFRMKVIIDNTSDILEIRAHGIILFIKAIHRAQFKAAAFHPPSPFRVLNNLIEAYIHAKRHCKPV